MAAEIIDLVGSDDESDDEGNTESSAAQSPNQISVRLGHGNIGSSMLSPSHSDSGTRPVYAAGERKESGTLSSQGTKRSLNAITTEVLDQVDVVHKDISANATRTRHVAGVTKRPSVPSPESSFDGGTGRIRTSLKTSWTSVNASLFAGSGLDVEQPITKNVNDDKSAKSSDSDLPELSTLMKNSNQRLSGELANCNVGEVGMVSTRRERYGDGSETPVSGKGKLFLGGSQSMRKRERERDDPSSHWARKKQKQPTERDQNDHDWLKDGDAFRSNSGVSAHQSSREAARHRPLPLSKGLSFDAEGLVKASLEHSKKASTQIDKSKISAVEFRDVVDERNLRPCEEHVAEASPLRTLRSATGPSSQLSPTESGKPDNDHNPYSRDYNAYKAPRVRTRRTATDTSLQQLTTKSTAAAVKVGRGVVVQMKKQLMMTKQSPRRHLGAQKLSPELRNEYEQSQERAEDQVEQRQNEGEINAEDDAVSDELARRHVLASPSLGASPAIAATVARKVLDKEVVRVLDESSGIRRVSEIHAAADATRDSEYASLPNAGGKDIREEAEDARCVQHDPDKVTPNLPERSTTSADQDAGAPLNMNSGIMAGTVTLSSDSGVQNTAEAVFSSVLRHNEETRSEGILHSLHDLSVLPMGDRARNAETSDMPGPPKITFNPPHRTASSRTRSQYIVKPANVPQKARQLPSYSGSSEAGRTTSGSPSHHPKDHGTSNAETKTHGNDREAVAGAVEEADEYVSSNASAFYKQSRGISAWSKNFQKPLFTEISDALTKRLTECQKDQEEVMKIWLRREREAKGVKKHSTCPVVPVSALAPAATSFLGLKPVQTLTIGVEKQYRELARFQNQASQGSNSKRFTEASFSAQITPYITPDCDPPSFTHYVSLKGSLLGRNRKQLHYWPRLESSGDDYSQSAMEDELARYYAVDIDDRLRKLKQMSGALRLGPYIDLFLGDIKCTMAEVLSFLVGDAVPEETAAELRKAVQHRDANCADVFDPESNWRAKILSKLPPVPTDLKMAALACEAFQHSTGYSLWNVARHDKLAEVQADNSDTHSEESNDMTCRICYRYNCAYHGDMLDDDNDSTYETDLGAPETRDLEKPPDVNRRRHVLFTKTPPSIGGTPMEDAFLTPSMSPKKNDRLDMKYWLESSKTTEHEKRPTFYPCDHFGTSCEDANCTCFEDEVMCEKSCICPPSCKRKFRGCSCSVTGRRKEGKAVCWEDERCECYRLTRECDASLCGRCGVDIVLDPVNRYDDEVCVGLCSNACIQKSVPKRTIVGDSAVHGLGLFIGEEVKAGEFVGEYKGEVVSKNESSRRGAVYWHQKTSYLFTINQDQEVDSTLMGNKIRFTNHSSKASTQNLRPRVILCNMVQRVALYATRDLTPGEELFFDYGPSFQQDSLAPDATKRGTQVLHMRNSKLAHDFWEKDDNDAEHAAFKMAAKKSLRHESTNTAHGARKGATAKGYRRGQGQGRGGAGTASRGGARPGAGRKPGRPRKQVDKVSTTDSVMKDAVVERVAPPEDRLAAYYLCDDKKSDDTEIDPAQDQNFEPVSEGEEQSESEKSDLDFRAPDRLATRQSMRYGGKQRRSARVMGSGKASVPV